MADGSIIIDARINKKGAEAELQALQAKAKSTAQQIAAVDTTLMFLFCCFKYSPVPERVPPVPTPAMK